MGAAEVKRAGQRNNGAVALRFGEHDQGIWPVAIVLLVMMTSACAEPELRALAAGGTGRAATLEPTVLAERELDSITAAGVVVDVASFAIGHGDRTLAVTRADTVALNREAYELAVGFTKGLALACCGEQADVEVGSVVTGSGDFVRGSTHGGENDDRDGRRFAYGLSLGFVLALSFKKNWGGTSDQRDAIVGELNATSTDFDTQLRAGASGFRPSKVR